MLLHIIDLTIILLLISVAFIDARTFLIPDELSFLIIGLALIQIFFLDDGDINDKLSGGLFSFAIFEITRRLTSFRLKRDTLGIGDVKLIIGGGLWLGLSQIPPAILIACFGGLIHFSILAAFYRMPINEQKIPFGPYLAGGLIIVRLSSFLDINSFLMTL